MADSSLIHAGSFYPAAPAASANTSTSHPTTSSPWQATILTQYNEASTSPSHASNPPLHTLAAPAYHAIKEIPRLSDLCRRILKANVAHIQDVGDVTYDLLRDILPGCRVDQLRDIEELSPHIAEEDEGECCDYQRCMYVYILMGMLLCRNMVRLLSSRLSHSCRSTSASSCMREDT